MKLGWKTITGALTFGIGVITSPELLAILPAKASTIVQTGGAVLSVIGLRHAQSKAEQAARELAAAVGSSVRAFRRGE